MSSSDDHLIAYGPNANCTLAICPITSSVYQYRPNLAANSIFIALFGLCMIRAIYQGYKWRTYWFTNSMVLGCMAEMIGYGGRIMLYQNPFSFSGFLMQICCITFAPVFFCAAIYFTLSKIVERLGREYSRLRPSYYYIGFLTCDGISLVLQASGGSLSSSSRGSSHIGVDTALAGLSFQVFTLSVFIGLTVDFGVRWWKATKGTVPLDRQFKIFVLALSTAIILILIRCIYRIDELSNGYTGSLIHNEGLFIALEGVMIIIAALTLNIAHPGPVFSSSSSSSTTTEENQTQQHRRRTTSVEKAYGASSDSSEQHATATMSV